MFPAAEELYSISKTGEPAPMVFCPVTTLTVERSNICYSPEPILSEIEASGPGSLFALPAHRALQTFMEIIINMELHNWSYVAQS